MARVRQTRDETRRAMVSRLDWRSAQRDDQAVAQAIHRGEGIDAIYNLDEAGLLDAFYHVLEDLGFLGLMGGLGLPGVKRVLFPVVPVRAALPAQNAVWDRLDARVAAPLVQQCGADAADRL